MTPGPEPPPRSSPAAPVPLPLVYAVFFLSGFAALLYQIVWQRALFTLYGTNVESVTIVVTAFMLGLGLGSLAGGAVSKRERVPLLAIFGGVELGIGAFGVVSLPLFRWVGSWTAGASGAATGALTLGLVIVPTLLMGGTLPLLVADLVRRSGNVGRSVGALYFVNTLGAAAGALAAGAWVLGAMGESGSVLAAAAVNGLVGAVVLTAAFVRRGSP